MAKKAQGATPAGVHAPDVDLKRAVHNRGDEALPWGTVLGFLLRRLAEHPFSLALGVLLSIGVALIDVFSLALFVPFLSALTGGTNVAEGTPLTFLVPYFEGLSDVGKIQLIAVLLFASQLVGGAFLYFATRNAQYLHLEVGRSVRMMLFDDLMRLEMRFINRERASNLFTLLHSFPAAASKIADQILIGIQNIARFIAMATLLVFISWQLTIVAGVLAVITSLIVIRLNKRIRARAGDIKASRLQLHSTTLEALNSMKVMHLFGRTGHTRNRFFAQLTRNQDDQYRQAAVSSLVQPAYAVLSTTMVALLIISATLVLPGSGGPWIGSLVLFLTVALKFTSQSGRFARRRAAIAKELPEMEAVLGFMRRPDKTYLTNGDKDFTELKEGVRFDNVRFRYEQDEPDVINGVSFDIPRGKLVALVGGSGAGKSTLVDLVARLYDPDEGRILVDGHDLRNYRINTWRRGVAVVSQDATVFNDTVRENIRYGRLDATDSEIEDAARQANAHDFITDLPHGYDTELGDRGVRLSGGQAQRLIIARAILADPEILVLDEATSALDTQTEHLVQAAIERASADRTILAIAHRLSTVRRADMILVLEKGQIVERGTHDALLAKKGAYWRYVQMQDLGRSDEAPPRPAHAEYINGDDGAYLLTFVLKDKATAPERALRGIPGVDGTWANGDRLILAVRNARTTIPRVFAVLADAGSEIVQFESRPVDEDLPPAGEADGILPLEPARRDDST